MARRSVYSPSIRQKIIFGYYVIVAGIVGISVFAFMELRYMERRISSGEAISEFLNTALEIRRFEKNYFLYGQQSDYEESLQYLDAARESFARNSTEFTALSSPLQTRALEKNLGDYKALMVDYGRLRGGADAARLVQEGKIRLVGKEIVTTAEALVKAERRNLQAFLSNLQNILILSILFLSLLGVAIGQLLSRMVVRPLKVLEETMEVIARGSYEKIRIASKDREIVSLTTAFNKMLKELELRRRHLLQSEKLASLGTLLSGVAHELNNPLSNISSSCQILAEELDEDDRTYKKELLAQIDAQTDRARNIVRSLLEFSRHTDFRKETLPLRGLVEETLRFVKGQAPATVELSLDIPQDLTVEADKQRLQQAFLNLIKNALEALNGGGRLSIQARRRRAVDKLDESGAEIYDYAAYYGKCTLEDATVDIEIRDTGPGIPPEVVPKIFDPFFTTKAVGKGSGLGLSIVHEIIEEHDGCIAVDSEVGVGTVFLIRLPIPKGR